MARNLAEKIIAEHLLEGTLAPGGEIALRIDQTLTQDATGTMAYLELEAMGIDAVKTELSVSYVDHNMLQADFRNADDHRYLQSVAAKYGIVFSRPGNGICHQVHLERFARPGRTLLGADSHTPTAGGIGSLAIGAGGLDVAAAMAGEPFRLAMPRVVGVHLIGQLSPWVSAKDIIIELQRRLTVKGGVGRLFEYFGPGVATLSVPQRATITNMGAELGATSSIFPSDERTRQYLKAQGREEQWLPLSADAGAQYDEIIELDLSNLEPLVSCPSSPDNVKPVRELVGTPLGQVCLGSCTNSSYRDLMTAAAVLRGRTVHPNVSLTVSPGSRQVLALLSRSGGLADLVAAGARILECGCGPCIGMGQAPASGVASLRSFNRNFKGRSGTPDDQVYLASPEVLAASAIAGHIADPRELGEPPVIAEPDSYVTDDNLIVMPIQEREAVEILRGPNIKPLPEMGPLPDKLEGPVLLKVGDNITTDHIMPAGAQVLPLRSNTPAISEYVFSRVDPSFPKRAREAGTGFVVGGSNYGQGSSREHAAIAPRYLGVRAVLVKSFARIHVANLINFGILPLEFVNPEDYDAIEQGDVLRLDNLRQAIVENCELEVLNKNKGTRIKVRHNLSERQVQLVLAGGLLNYFKSRGE
ncbi:MAG: aconitate hydratase [Anaerolineae bacterium]